MAQATKTVVREVGSIERKGHTIVLQADTLEKGDSILHREMEYENEIVAVTRNIQCFPWDGAIALHWAIGEKFGAVFVEALPDMFSEGVAREISVATGVDEVTKVPWGRLFLPGAPRTIKDRTVNFLQTGIAEEHGAAVFQVQAAVQRKYLEVIEEVFKLTAERTKVCSIYRGKAIKVRFRDDAGEKLKLPDVTFVDLKGVDVKGAVFNRDLERDIDAIVFGPIRDTTACIEDKAPVRRGVLFAGKYGTGKTYLMGIIAKEATANGWTSILLHSADELVDALPFAGLYGPCVVECEDIDRVTSGPRDKAIDKVLNNLDGIESKSRQVSVVCTTNHPELITKAMMRPGRLDVTLYVDPPDAEAATRLVRSVGGALLDPLEDMSEVGEALAGVNPAIIKEVVDRAKLYKIARTHKSGGRISKDDLLLSARMKKKEDERMAVEPMNDKFMPLYDMVVKVPSA